MTAGPEPVAPEPSASLGRDVARSSVWSLGGQVVALVVAFVATPFTVRLLGPEGYGLVALVNSLIAYVAVLDLGMGTASTRFASEAYARNDPKGEAAAVWTAAAITFLPCAIFVVSVWIGASLFVERFLHLTPNLRGSGTLALRLGAIALVARILGAVLNTPQLVRLRWNLYVLITNGTGIAQVIAVPFVAATGAGAGAVMGVSAVAAVTALVLHVVASIRLAPAMRRPTIEGPLAKALVRFGGGLVVANVLGVILGSGERFILAATHPIRAVAHYAVAASLSQVIGIVPIAVCQPILPAFARLKATSDSEQSALLYRRALTSILAGILPIAVALSVIGRPFLEVWAGKEYGISSVTPLRVLLVGVVINACAFVPYNFLLGIGESRAVVRCHLYEVPLYPIYGYLLISRFGATGAALVWTLRLVLVTGIMFVAAARRGGASSAPFAEVAVRLGPAIAVLILPLLADLLTSGPVIPSIVLVAALPVYAQLAWTRAIEPEDRTQIRSLLRIGRRE